MKRLVSQSFLLCFFILAKAQLPYKIIENPEYRIAKIVSYTSKDFDIPKEINENTVRYEERVETKYCYQGNRLSCISTQVYNGDSIKSSTIDSIFYLTSDSVLIKTSYKSSYNKEQKTYEYHKKLEDPRKMISNILSGKEKSYIDEFENIDIKLVNSFPDKLISKGKGNKYISRFIYDKNKVLTMIKHSGDNRTESVDSFIYPDKNSYQVSSAGGNLWCCSFHYYFDDNGYLIKSGIESDTNASIKIYEYEKGKGNAILFEKENPFHIIQRMSPLIY